MEDSKGFALRMGRGGIPRQVKPAAFRSICQVPVPLTGSGMSGTCPLTDLAGLGRGPLLETIFNHLPVDDLP